MTSQGGPLKEKRGFGEESFVIVPSGGLTGSGQAAGSLPRLRGEVIDLSQVLHGRAFVGVRQLDPHS